MSILKICFISFYAATWVHKMPPQLSLPRDEF